MLNYKLKKDKNFKKVIIVGAGKAGNMTLNKFKKDKNLQINPVGFIDDDLDKQGKEINGIPVLGNQKDIYKICEKNQIDKIIIAIPSARGHEIREIIEESIKTNCEIKILGKSSQESDSKVNISEIRDIQIEDVLDGKEINSKSEELSRFIKGKRIMVTGGSGFVGSELCRQIALYNPKNLIILDVYENNAYDLQNELLNKYKKLNLKVFLTTIRDKVRLDEIMEEEKPEIIFHAAANKNIPLMEFNPKEAIRNNVFGTLNMVEAANKHNVEKFVMISTDEAAKPNNVMGATKRIGEMIIQSLDGTSNTDYIAVRFGNTLKSNEKIIPLFKKEIKDGGPLTLGNREEVRYLMTITEVCQLVLKAGSMSSGGEIYALDMGEPVKILDLAKDLIRLYGFKPVVDIKIQSIGLKSGDKLDEALVFDKERMAVTDDKKIYLEDSMTVKYEDLLRHMDLLKISLKSYSNSQIKNLLKTIVTDYYPNMFQRTMGEEVEEIEEIEEI